jgi:hypothetical protein
LFDSLLLEPVFGKCNEPSRTILTLSTIHREGTGKSSDVLEKSSLGIIMPCRVATNELQINVHGMDEPNTAA